MRHKPIDEMSLRHLFSTKEATNILNIEYWGPVLNDRNNIESSPDCLVLDKRTNPYTLKRCEFKYEPTSINDFSHNGRFDIAIVWNLKLPNTISLEEFKQRLQQQNGCSEVIVLTDRIEFSTLPNYTAEQRNFHNITPLEGLLNRIEHDDIVFGAYIIAKSYPQPIHSQDLIKLLVEKFPRVGKMSPQGRGNVISRYGQMKPPLVTKLYRNCYVWNNQDFNAEESIRILEAHITNVRNFDVPQDDMVRRVQQITR